MSDGSVNPANLNPATVSVATPERRQAVLRQAVGEMVGETFFGQMLKIARNSPLKSELGHGGRGEDIFAAQLDQELARRAGQGAQNGLAEAIYRRLVGRA